MPLQVDRPADLAAFVGTELQSEAFALTQSDIDRFVALSGDPQWIHSDVARGLGRRRRRVARSSGSNPDVCPRCS
jgi:acyl dehydratase